MHSCQQCGCACYCGGDIDDCDVGDFCRVGCGCDDCEDDDVLICRCGAEVTMAACDTCGRPTCSERCAKECRHD
jgi:hypothetical protein